MTSFYFDDLEENRISYSPFKKQNLIPEPIQSYRGFIHSLFKNSSNEHQYHIKSSIRKLYTDIASVNGAIFPRTQVENQVFSNKYLKRKVRFYNNNLSSTTENAYAFERTKPVRNISSFLFRKFPHKFIQNKSQIRGNSARSNLSKSIVKNSITDIPIRLSKVQHDGDTKNQIEQEYLVRRGGGDGNYEECSPQIRNIDDSPESEIEAMSNYAGKVIFNKLSFTKSTQGDSKSVKFEKQWAKISEEEETENGLNPNESEEEEQEESMKTLIDQSSKYYKKKSRSKSVSNDPSCSSLQIDEIVSKVRDLSISLYGCDSKKYIASTPNFIPNSNQQYKKNCVEIDELSLINDHVSVNTNSLTEKPKLLSETKQSITSKDDLNTQNKIVTESVELVSYNPVTKKDSSTNSESGKVTTSSSSQNSGSSSSCFGGINDSSISSHKFFKDFKLNLVFNVNLLWETIPMIMTIRLPENQEPICNFQYHANHYPLHTYCDFLLCAEFVSRSSEIIHPLSSFTLSKFDPGELTFQYHLRIDSVTITLQWIHEFYNVISSIEAKSEMLPILHESFKEIAILNEVLSKRPSKLCWYNSLDSWDEISNTDEQSFSSSHNTQATKENYSENVSVSLNTSDELYASDLEQDCITSEIHKLPTNDDSLGYEYSHCQFILNDSVLHSFDDISDTALTETDKTIFHHALFASWVTEWIYGMVRISSFVLLSTLQHFRKIKSKEHFSNITNNYQKCQARLYKHNAIDKNLIFPYDSITIYSVDSQPINQTKIVTMNPEECELPWKYDIVITPMQSIRNDNFSYVNSSNFAKCPEYQLKFTVFLRNHFNNFGMELDPSDAYLSLVSSDENQPTDFVTPDNSYTSDPDTNVNLSNADTINSESVDSTRILVTKLYARIPSKAKNGNTYDKISFLSNEPMPTISKKVEDLNSLSPQSQNHFIIGSYNSIPSPHITSLISNIETNPFKTIYCTDSVSLKPRFLNSESIEKCPKESYFVEDHEDYASICSSNVEQVKLFPESPENFPENHIESKRNEFKLAESTGLKNPNICFHSLFIQSVFIKPNIEYDLKFNQICKHISISRTNESINQVTLSSLSVKKFNEEALKISLNIKSCETIKIWINQHNFLILNVSENIYENNKSLWYMSSEIEDFSVSPIEAFSKTNIENNIYDKSFTSIFILQISECIILTGQCFILLYPTGNLFRESRTQTSVEIDYPKYMKGYEVKYFNLTISEYFCQNHQDLSDIYQNESSKEIYAKPSIECNRHNKIRVNCSFNSTRFVLLDKVNNKYPLSVKVENTKRSNLEQQGEVKNYNKNERENPNKTKYSFNDNSELLKYIVKPMYLKELENIENAQARPCPIPDVISQPSLLTNSDCKITNYSDYTREKQFQIEVCHSNLSSENEDYSKLSLHSSLQNIFKNHPAEISTSNQSKETTMCNLRIKDSIKSNLEHSLEIHTTELDLLLSTSNIHETNNQKDKDPILSISPDSKEYGKSFNENLSRSDNLCLTFSKITETIDQFDSNLSFSHIDIKETTQASEDISLSDQIFHKIPNCIRNVKSENMSRKEFIYDLESNASTKANRPTNLEIQTVNTRRKSCDFNLLSGPLFSKQSLRSSNISILPIPRSITEDKIQNLVIKINENDLKSTQELLNNLLPTPDISDTNKQWLMLVDHDFKSQEFLEKCINEVFNFFIDPEHYHILLSINYDDSCLTDDLSTTKSTTVSNFSYSSDETCSDSKSTLDDHSEEGSTQSEPNRQTCSQHKLKLLFRPRSKSCPILLLPDDYHYPQCNEGFMNHCVNYLQSIQTQETVPLSLSLEPSRYCLAKNTEASSYNCLKHDNFKLHNILDSKFDALTVEVSVESSENEVTDDTMSSSAGFSRTNFDNHDKMESLSIYSAPNIINCRGLIIDNESFQRIQKQKSEGSSTYPIYN